MKIKTIIFLSLLFITINSIGLIITTLNKKQNIDTVLAHNLNALEIHYNILLFTQKKTADAIYLSTIAVDGLLDIIQKAQDASDEEKMRLRSELKKKLDFKYAIIKQQGVLQYQFLLPSNESFLRMHKPEKYGDDLTDVRADFKYVNETHKPTRGFVQGRVVHGFRNTFPLVSKDGKYIGAMEVSFASESFQWYLNNISKVHTHFLVDNTIFSAKAWKRDDLILHYTQSAEHKDLMITLTDVHNKETCINENAIKLAPVKQEIKSGIKKAEAFSLYVHHKDHIDVVSYLPVKNLAGDVVAWLVSYEQSYFIEITLLSAWVINVVTLLSSLILMYFLVSQIHSREVIHRLLKKTEKKVYTDGLTNVYNRNKFDEVFEAELLRVQRYKNKLSVAIIDIDKFKDFNDNHGHLIGDEVLISLAKNVSGGIRDTDTFARWGGEEFIILFKETSIEDAKEVCEKLRRGIEHNEHEEAGKITASFGVTQYMEGDTVESIFKRCDEALYYAKENGRNRVEFF